ncbi:MAG: hypothetical protein P8Y68_17770 [Anaerolineales bacterium]
MNKQMSGLILLGLLILTACNSEGPPLATSPEDIVGIFAVHPGNTILRFDPDGTTVAAPSLYLAKNPVGDPGYFRFEGNHLIFESADDPDPVCGGATAIYQVQLLEEGKLRFVAIEDDCQHRVNVFQGPINEETGQPRNVWSPTE